MGVFNERCMVTGICLYDVSVILLTEDGPLYRPCSLPFEGRWDSYGSVDSFEADQHLELLATSIKAALRTGRLTTDCADSRLEPIEELDDTSTVLNKLIAMLWLDAAEDKRRALLAGKRLRAAMIGRGIAARLASGVSTDVQANLETSLGSSDAAKLLYADAEALAASLARRCQQLAALSAALRQRSIAWLPVGPTGMQFGRREEKQAVREACMRFRDDLALAQPLLQYAREHSDSSLTFRQLLGTEWVDDEFL